MSPDTRDWRLYADDIIFASRRGRGEKRWRAPRMDCRLARVAANERLICQPRVEDAHWPVSRRLK